MAGPGRTGPAPRPPAERFLQCLEVADSGCWIWTAGEKTGGYGAFFDGQRTVFAHRWAYEFWNGPIPDRFQVDHLCRVRRCVNPLHLEAVTQAENIYRGKGFSAVNARKTHCPQGHEYAGANLRLSRKGHRHCRTCERVQDAARKAKKRRAA